MNLCQVTSGDDWHPGPFAQWLKRALGKRSRYWLEGEIVQRTGKKRPAVAKAVNRWTKHGDQPEDEQYVAALTALFGSLPAAAETKTYRDHEKRIASLEEYRETIKRLAAAIPEDQALLRRNGEIRELLHRLRAAE
jgi:hypothetical protein